MVCEPNFFIIGAPKCGTTAMSEYLRSHPDVFMSRPKEPHFFDFDMVQSYYGWLDDYLSLFAKARHRIVGEATPSYLRSRVAVPAIRGLFPDSKLLIMLRNPVDLVYSLYNERRRAGGELTPDFAKAWALEVAGRAPKHRGKYIVEDRPYIFAGQLGAQVKRVLEIFPRDQVRIILFDDFVSNPRAEYLRLLAFLKIPDDGRTEFPKVNESTGFKSKGLAQASRYARVWGLPYLMTFKRLTGIRHIGVLRAIDRFNTAPRSVKSLDPGIYRQMADAFSDEIRLLEDLLNRDLSSWRHPPEAQT